MMYFNKMYFIKNNEQNNIGISKIEKKKNF